MKKRIPLLFILVFITQLNFGQLNSHIKNKLALEYNLDFSPMQIGLEEYSYLSATQKLKSTKFFHSLNINYKLRSKIALSLVAGYHKNNLTPRYGYYDYSNEKLSDREVYMKGNQIGVGLKFYFRNHRAPLGNSFDVFLKNQSFKIDANQMPDYSGSDYTLNMTLLGVSLNYITMITNKLPVYLKYSASVFAPIVRNENIPTYKSNGIEEDNIDLSNNGGSEDDLKIVSNYRNLNWFKFHVGIGYAF